MMSYGHFQCFKALQTSQKYWFLYHLLKEKHIDLDCHDFLGKSLQHIYFKTTKIHFAQLLIYDVGWTIYFPKLVLLCRECCPNFETLVRYLSN